MAPMSTNLADEYGRATVRLVEYLKRRARGGCGMIIIESATVEAVLGSTGRKLRLDREDCLSSLRHLVREIHSCGTKAAVQLWHAGPRAGVENGLPRSPSGTLPGFPVSRALSRFEIETIVKQFIAAGDRAVRAGFDALEIHAAHGYLLHHFIDRQTNRRQDIYGGSIAARYRILQEIRQGLGAMHPNIPLLLRISLGPDDDLAAVANTVEAAGFDAIDVRTGFSSMAKTTENRPVAAGYTLALSRRLRAHTSLPLLTGGRILTPQAAAAAIRDFGLDAVVLGRPLLADPDWAANALKGSEVRPCRYDCDPSCYTEFKKGAPLHCVIYGRLV
jgi:2,4-dienoyl-CoA reductase-like NADH-dependent reductase (Old Yellow Enzyme family)